MQVGSVGELQAAMKTQKGWEGVVGRLTWSNSERSSAYTYAGWGKLIDSRVAAWCRSRMVVLGTGTNNIWSDEGIFWVRGVSETFSTFLVLTICAMPSQPVVQNVDHRVNTLVQLREYGSQQAQTTYTGRLSRVTSKRYAFYKRMESGCLRSLSSI